jgi:hypothetical protein
METKVMVVSRTKSRVGKKYRSAIRLSGLWLDAIGFDCGTLAKADYQNGSITLKASGKGLDTYNGLVREVMDNKAGLFQVCLQKSHGKSYPVINIVGFWVEELGFSIGSVFVVMYEYGVIHIKLLDLRGLTLP